MYECRKIEFSVRGRSILRGIDLVLPPGKVTVIVGPNGAGKSTFLKLLAGEHGASAGEVTLDGRPLAAWSVAELARRQAVLPQSASVAFAFSVFEIVSLGIPIRLDRAKVAETVAHALEAVELGGFANRLYHSLSGGERQRVHFARALVQISFDQGGYLLLDEPTTSLDIAYQLLALRLARTHAYSGGGTIMILHDLNLAAMVADEIVALKDGRIVAAGAPCEVITNSVLSRLYGVSVQVGEAPAGPFVLPQSVRSIGGAQTI